MLMTRTDKINVGIRIACVDAELLHPVVGEGCQHSKKLFTQTLDGEREGVFKVTVFTFTEPVAFHNDSRSIQCLIGVETLQVRALSRCQQAWNHCKTTIAELLMKDFGIHGDSEVDHIFIQTYYSSRKPLNPNLADLRAGLALTMEMAHLASVKIHIPTPREFSYELNLQFLLRSPRELLHRVEDNVVWKLLLDHEPVLIRLAEGDGCLECEFVNQSPSEDVQARVVQYVREWFDLDTDLRPFYRLVKDDALLGPLVKKYKGYRIIGQPDLFESLVWAVLGQQINLAFAYTLKQRFVERYGRQLKHRDQTYYAFPTPAAVAQIHPEDLLPLQFSNQKARYTVTIAEAFACGQVSKEKLAGLPLQEAKEILMAIKGVGNWTANYALMKTFRYPDAFPLEDAGVHNAIKNLKNMKAKPTLDTVKRIFKKYKGWEAYATLYLWKSL